MTCRGSAEIREDPDVLRCMRLVIGMRSAAQESMMLPNQTRMGPVPDSSFPWWRRPWAWHYQNPVHQDSGPATTRTPVVVSRQTVRTLQEDSSFSIRILFTIASMNVLEKGGFQRAFHERNRKIVTFGHRPA
jgi:hypothetical protein